MMTTPGTVWLTQMDLHRAEIGKIPTQVAMPLGGAGLQDQDRAAMEAAEVLPGAAMRAGREAYRVAQDHRATEVHRATQEHREGEALRAQEVRAEMLDKMHPGMVEDRMMRVLIRSIRARF